MRRLSTLRPSPALIVAMAALVMAMSGAAIALPGKGSVKKNDIAKGAVTTKALASAAVKTKTINKGAVGSQQIKGKSIKGNRIKDGGIKAKQIADATITGKKIENETITGQQVAVNGLSSQNLSDFKVLGAGGVNLVRANATNGADADAAQAAAPEIPLFSKGQISVYGKCFHITPVDETWAATYVKTAAAGAIFWTEFATGEGLPGGNTAADFLNPNTPEFDRQLTLVTTAGPEASMESWGFDVVGVDQTHLNGRVMTAAKNGELAAGNGVYGAGNTCLFGGQIAG